MRTLVSCLTLLALIAATPLRAATALDESIPEFTSAEEQAEIARMREYARARRTLRKTGLTATSTEGVVASDPRIEGIRAVPLNANSTLYLYSPAVGDVRLTGRLENTSESTGTTPAMTGVEFFTLYPVDQPRQQVFDLKFTPAGQLRTDDEGQKLVYHSFPRINPGEVAEATWRARVRTWNMLYDIDPADVGPLTSVPAQIANSYLKDETIYQINHATVVAARNEALAGETNPYHMARKIFAWAQAHISYLAEGGWDPAPTVIARGNGSCSESAYAFIAMCRSVGLPARLSGSVVRRGDETGPGPYLDEPNHRWADVYLPGVGWMECNVSGGTWGYLPNRYLILSKAGGPSNYMSDSYTWRRRYSWTGGTGTYKSTRQCFWYSNRDHFYALRTTSSGLSWVSGSPVRVSWDILGDAETGPLALELCRMGKTVWSATGIDPHGPPITIPLGEIPASGPHFFLEIYRADAPGISGVLGPVEIAIDRDNDGLDDNWEIHTWGNWARDEDYDGDGDGSSNLCEYLGMTAGATSTLFASDLTEATASVGSGTVGHNEYGCGGATGKIVAGGIAWDKSLGVVAPSHVEYQVPEGTAYFQALAALEDHRSGDALFEIERNGEPVYTSPRLNKSSGVSREAVLVRVPVEPGDRLRLLSDSLFSSLDHTAWLSPAFLPAEALAPNASPEAAMLLLPASGPAPLSADLIGFATDPDGLIVAVGWNLAGTGLPDASRSVVPSAMVQTSTSSVFDSPGVYPIAFYAWDNESAFAWAEGVITVWTPTPTGTRTPVVTPTPTPLPPYVDLFGFSLQWRQSPGGAYDFNGDGGVDEADLLLLIEGEAP